VTAVDPTQDSVASVYFKLQIDDYDLGVFTTCSGLGMQMNLEAYQEGGGWMFVHQLVGAISYTNLQVTRPIGPWTALTMTWLNMMATAGDNGVKPTTAVLSALAPDGSTVFSWSLQGVVPASWTGPSFDAGSPQQVNETLEIAYSAIMAEPPAQHGSALAEQ
jgi:phage tail-like protein